LDATLLALGAGSLVCLTPLGLYFLYLSYLNGRVPSTLVRGPWDLGALFLGLSGFFVLAGPVLLTLVDSAWRYYAFGNWAALKGVGRAEARAWSLMGTGWFFMWLGIIPLLLRARRHITAAYNIAPTLIETQFTDTLDELGYAWQRVDGYIAIDTTKHSATNATSQRFHAGSLAYVRILVTPATGHALFRWSGQADSLRDTIEAILPNALSRSLPVRNPVAGWLFIVAVVIMGLMLVWIALMFMILLAPM
jgi:hypothetical protein